jgi:hypothetical protein
MAEGTLFQGKQTFAMTEKILFVPQRLCLLDIFTGSKSMEKK